MNTFKNLGSSNPFYTLSFIVWTDKVQIIQTQQNYGKKTFTTLSLRNYLN